MKFVRMSGGRSWAGPSGAIGNGGQGWVSDAEAAEIVKVGAGEIINNAMDESEWLRKFVDATARLRKSTADETREAVNARAEFVKKLYTDGGTPETSAAHFVNRFGYGNAEADAKASKAMAARLEKAGGELKIAQHDMDNANAALVEANNALDESEKALNASKETKKDPALIDAHKKAGEVQQAAADRVRNATAALASAESAVKKAGGTIEA